MRKIGIHALCVVTLFNLIFSTPVMAQAVVKTAPVNSSFKSWMSYKCFNSGTAQSQLQSLAETDSNGLRIVNGRYCVALGSYYTTEIGTQLDVELSTGVTLPCILGDSKADIHTDPTNRQSNSGNGNVVEFIVDTNLLNHEAKNSGTVSSIPGFEGDVVSITVLTPDVNTFVVPAEGLPAVSANESVETPIVADVVPIQEVEEYVTGTVENKEIEEAEDDTDNEDVARASTPFLVVSCNSVDNLTGEGFKDLAKQTTEVEKVMKECVDHMAP